VREAIGSRGDLYSYRSAARENLNGFGVRRGRGVLDPEFVEWTRFDVRHVNFQLCLRGSMGRLQRFEREPHDRVHVSQRRSRAGLRDSR
jgi:hypothetical protein